MQEAFLSLLHRLLPMPFLQQKYVFAGVIILIAILFSQVLLLLFNFYLKSIASKTKSQVDDLIFDRTKKPLFFFVLVYGLKLALFSLDIDGVLTNVTNSLMAAVFIFILMRVLDIIIETWGMNFAKQTKTNLDEVLLPLFHRAAKVVFVLILLMWILHIWGIDITPYLAGVGLSGIVLGLALQDSLKNVFGGISLIMDRSFNLGEKIQLESGELGEITEIGLRSTKLLTPDHEIIFIPNGQLANMRIRNLAKPTPKLRKTVDFSVEYGTDIDKMRKVVLQTIQSMKGVYEDPAPEVVMVEMGDYGLKFKARFWIEWKFWHEKWVEATEKIYLALQKAKIGIPYPTHTVHMKK